MTPEELHSIVVCFLFDGSEKYIRMTLNAVNSFISTTPHIRVGLLFPQGYDETVVTRQVADPSRVVVRRYETHFANWNPTQHKLDIIKFSDQFSTIFWLDSDAIVYQDLTDLLVKFHSSPCKVAFMKDHVCYNPQFLNVWLDWRKVSDPFIPQASFMGFKKEIMPSFFAAWKDTWRKWIEPVPFMNFPNPVPSFPGSAFCTEQYALGMVLESDVVVQADIYELRRITFPLKGIVFPNNGNGNQASTSASIDFNVSYSGLSLSENELSLLEDKFRRQLSFSSWGGSWGAAETSWGGSWNETSWGAGETSWGAGQTSWGSTETSFSYPSESFSTSSWANIYPEFSFSFSSWESSPSSFSGSFSGSFEFGSSFSFGGSFSSFATRGLWAPVDNIEGRIVHFYSTFYDQSANWWSRNSEQVIPQINQYWDNRNSRPAYIVVPHSTVPTTPSQNYYSLQPQSQRVSPPHQRRDDVPGL